MTAQRRAPRTIRVGLNTRPYDVVVGADLLPTLGRRILESLAHDAPARSHLPRRAFVIADANLPREIVATAIASLTEAGYLTTGETVAATEQNKSIAAAERLLLSLARTRHERTDPVIALGGGVTGDLAGFVASIYRRGVPVIQCPTTLLAMVDAAVGGKTAVNLHLPATDGTEPRLLKNLVGSFHQPSLVLCDARLLASLPDHHFRAGLAECIKHALLGADWREPDLLDWTTANLPSILDRTETHLIELIARNLAVKAAVVAADEREDGDCPGGGRLALNMGHTIAHAIETLPIPHLGRSLLHGEAVALGLIAEAACGERLGATARGTADRITGLVRAAGLPASMPELPSSEEILAGMLHDKKTAGGRLRLALPTGDGRCRIVFDPPEEAIRAGIDRIRGEPDATSSLAPPR